MSKLEDPGEDGWLMNLTDAELAYWGTKPQSEKEWWDANTKPADRLKTLRTEIAAATSHQRFLRLPKATRETILKRVNAEADAARVRLRQRGFGVTEQGAKTNDTPTI